jgi:hypothetical protein
MSAHTKKAPVGQLAPLIFRVFPPASNPCAIVEAEERGRIAAARRQAHQAMASSIRADIRAIMPDGKGIAFPLFPAF